MALKLQSILHDPDHYVKALGRHTVLSNSEFNVEVKWAESAFSETVVAKLQAEPEGQEHLRVLGVGSGSGELDVEMLTQLLQRFPHINNRVVEPSVDQLIQYKALVRARAHELQGAVCDWRQQTIDQYEKAGDATKFHFISAVHSIYYAENVDSTLMYLYDRLEAGGVMLVMIISDDSGYWQLWSRFKGFQDRLVTFISSSHVRGLFDRRGVPYTRHRQPCCADITHCFDAGASEDGSLSLDVLTHVLRFRETAPADLQREVMECLASSVCSEKGSDGRVLFKNDSDAIVVRKPLN